MIFFLFDGQTYMRIDGEDSIDHGEESNQHQNRIPLGRHHDGKTSGMNVNFGFLWRTIC